MALVWHRMDRKRSLPVRWFNGAVAGAGVFALTLMARVEYPSGHRYDPVVYCYPVSCIEEDFLWDDLAWTGSPVVPMRLVLHSVPELHVHCPR